MKKVFIFSILMSVAVIARAQFQQFHAGVSLPSGKFGDGNEKTEYPWNGKGFAAMGFNMGYKLYNPLTIDEGLTWVFGIEAFYNPLNTDLKDKIEKTWKNITPSMYLNFSATFGLNYAVPLNEKLKLYGEAALGSNFSYITDFDMEDSSSSYQKYKFTPLFGLAWGLEAGLFIDSKYSIGLRHNNLGSYKFKYEIDYPGDRATSKEKFDKALPVTVTSVCLGLLF
ncbi:MAG: porin family protein [Dysgonamonadaceae bacterium]|jgi:hypothetical protein|nr:porin family protein [Dysgonamonadaceae bacterium]